MSKTEQKQMRKRLSELGIKNVVIPIRIMCMKCKTIDSVNTNKPEVYTEEIKKTYLCWRCKSPKTIRIVMPVKKEERIENKELIIVEKQEKLEILKTIIKKSITKAIIEIFSEDFISIEDASAKIASEYPEKRKSQIYFIKRISDILKISRYQPKNYNIERSEDNKYKFIKK